MVDLVWVEHVDGSKSPVNPARVQYLRLTNTRDTALVFGAFAGGFDQLVVRHSAHEALEILAGRLVVEPPPNPVEATDEALEAAEPPPKAKRSPKPA